jgi:hypothetical protein
MQFWPAAKTAPDEQHLAVKLDSFVKIREYTDA